MNPDQLLPMLTADWIRSADTDKLEEIVVEIGTLPKVSFPTYQRLHERAALIERELMARRARVADEAEERRHQEQVDVGKHRTRRAEQLAFAALIISLCSAFGTCYQAYHSHPPEHNLRMAAPSAGPSASATIGPQMASLTETPTVPPLSETPTAPPPQDSSPSAGPKP